MSFRVTVISKDAYLHLRVEGENSLESVAGYLEEVGRLLGDEGADLMLLEEHLTGPSLAPQEIYQLVCEAIERWPPPRAMAYVDTATEHDPSMMVFAETVALNRGARMRLCSTVAEAQAWLLEKADD